MHSDGVLPVEESSRAVDEEDTVSDDRQQRLLHIARETREILPPIASDKETFMMESDGLRHGESAEGTRTLVTPDKIEHYGESLSSVDEPQQIRARMTKGKSRQTDADLDGRVEVSLDSETMKNTSEAGRPIDAPEARPIPPTVPPRHQARPSGSQPAQTRTNELVPLEDISYMLKTITFNGERLSIICQSFNGACPLLSIANFLSLSSRMKLPLDQREISAPRLTDLLADFLLSNDGDLSVLDELEGLHRGLNVDPEFTGVNHFRDGQEIMKAFGGELVHGWLPSSADHAYALLTAPGGQEAAGSESMAVNTNFTSYEAAQIQVVTLPESDFSIAINTFFLDHPTNLTPTGLSALREHMKDGEMSILFYNSHFSLLYKHPSSGDLYTLVTDAGYLESGDNVVWENLVLNSPSQFYTAEFIPQAVLGETRQGNDAGPRGQGQDSAQTEDEKLARRLHAEETGVLEGSDKALALRLQEEERARDRERTRDLDRQRQEDQRRVDEYNGIAPISGTAEPVESGSAHAANTASSSRHQDHSQARRKKDCIVM